MKKKHAYNVVSDRTCKCGKAIKLRMVEQKDAKLCYTCFCKAESLKGHTVNSQPRKKRIIKGLPVKTFS